jgi:ubiquinone/menaquinone biosynthesis C-methylase UbiE
MIGGGLGPFKPGEWTDDTSMAIAIAEIAATGTDLREEAALDYVVDCRHRWARTPKMLACRPVRCCRPRDGEASRIGERIPALHPARLTKRGSGIQSWSWTPSRFMPTSRRRGRGPEGDRRYRIDAIQRWRANRVIPAIYDAGIKHDRVAMVGAWTQWGADMRLMYAEIARLADTPVGTSVLDIPCGGGLAFRGLRTGHAVRYVAADISPYMLQLARREARRREVQDGIEFVEADMSSLQYPDASFDLCVTYNGLHCLPDPRLALGELTRVLRPGGTLRGTSCVTGRGVRQDALIAMYRRARIFGNVPHAGQIETWLMELGLDVVTLERSGAVERFEARLPLPGP